ncbi:MAG: hypothetical protein IRZ16_14075 [Myxococcaceae bacterium]|nr:hypothetical protein [Myxococcaceae bacterium]
MLSQLLAATALLFTVGVHPGEYSEKSLCDLWAGARCHATACMPDGKQRCADVSAQCRGASNATVPSKDHAERVATCARALLKAHCGDPLPAECEGVDGP